MAFTFYENQSSEPQKPKRQYNVKISKKWLFVALAAIVVLIVSSTCFFSVDQAEQAVVLRFGSYLKTVGPGLHSKLPFGIDKNYNVATQSVQTLTFGYRTETTGNSFGQPTTYLYSDYASESTMLTGDLNIVDIQWIVQYKVEDPMKWLFSVQNNKQTISDISRSVINQIVGDLPILSIMSSERTNIEVEAEEKMQRIFDSYNMGVKILTVKLQDIVPPAGDVQDAFEDVNKAIQDMNKLINEGKENYNKIIPSAEGEANKIIQEANGYASERVNTAQGDVDRFNLMLNEYEKAKEITSQRLYIETLEQIFSSENGDLTIIDKNLENYLPISNISGGNK